MVEKEKRLRVYIPGSFGHNCVGTYLFFALKCKTIHYFVIRWCGRKFVGKDRTWNLQTLNPHKQWPFYTICVLDFIFSILSFFQWMDEILPIGIINQSIFHSYTCQKNNWLLTHGTTCLQENLLDYQDVALKY